MLVKVLDKIIPLWGAEETARSNMTRWGTTAPSHTEKRTVKYARKGKEHFGESLCESP